MADKVLQSLDQGIPTLTLNREAVQMSSTRTDAASSARAWTRRMRPPDVGAIVVTGAGTKAFSVGFDLTYADANPEVYRTPLFGS